ncbi:MAG: CBS domain-containing protein [Candidatus Methanomethylicia archaeon]
MLIKDILSKPPVTVKYGTSLHEAAQIMVRENIGILPIVNPENQRNVLGVVSERDFVKAFSIHKEPQKIKVEDVGTMGNIVTVKQSDTISKAALLMIQHNIRHLIVVNDENLLVGVVSIRDIIETQKILEMIAKAY